MANSNQHIEPTPQNIQKYLDGKLDDKAMHDLERQALDDPFLAEALEGYAERDFDQSKNLDDLNARLQARVVESGGSEMPLIVNINKKRKVDYRWAAAAVILVLLSVGSFWVWERETGNSAKVAQEIVVAPKVEKDSVSNSPGVDNVDNVRLREKSSPKEIKEDNKAIKDAKPEQPPFEGEAKPNKAEAPPAMSEVSPAARDAKQAYAKREGNSAGLMQYKAKMPSKNAGRQIAFGLKPNKIDTILIMRSTAASYLDTIGEMKGKLIGKELEYGNGKYVDAYLVDKFTNDAIANVLIKSKSNQSYTRTDSSGKFRMLVDDAGDQNLTFAMQGFDDKRVELNNRNQDLFVYLDRKGKGFYGNAGNGDIEMNEPIQITAIGTSPLIGRDAYKLYLATQLHHAGLPSKSGTMMFSFKVKGNSGEVSGLKFLKSISAEYDRAVKKIIEKGSNWQVPADGSDTEVHVTWKLYTK
ncbi:hypothetical protein COR50_06195 [Chitinophaga caeni]|uniref:TonB C-terminal domain-containing protein n=1 Tax=Chitinophaga caeni TaxID=2029983 RepID=A0A291QS62_9BACT|nr:hypothetical protein [Chitinophaga caeni]ATL46800.1 hypothetical protein COR50_06195 [Chitinophaga caeni]